MANKKVFTDESLETFVDEVKSYTDNAVSAKANSAHNHSASNITSGTLSSDRLPTVPIARGGTGATTSAAALTNLGITATAAELNKLDGITATTTELNYVDGVTSNIQTQLDGKASSSHTHNYAGSSSAGGAATSANKVNSSLTVKLNGGTTEGTNMFTFNGSAAKSVNITPSAIGAQAAGSYASSNHTHDDRYYTESEIDSKLSGKASSSHTHTAATTSADGFMSASDKAKLNGIAAGANAYSLPTASSSTLGGVKTGSNITNSNGTISLTKANVTSALGYTPPTTNTTYSNATQSAAGLMSAADKAQLNNGGIPIVTTTSAGITVDGHVYVAEIPEITELVVGMKITIIPHTSNLIENPSLNINSLGQKQICQRIITDSSSVSTLKKNMLVAGTPITVTYDGTYWIIDIPKTIQTAQKTFVNVGISSGKTYTTVTTLANMGIPDDSTIISFYIAGWSGGDASVLNCLALSSDKKSICLIGESGSLITTLTLVVVYI